MKQAYIILLLLALALVALSCNKNENPTPTPGDCNFKFSPSALVFKKTGGSQTARVENNHWGVTSVKSGNDVVASGYIVADGKAEFSVVDGVTFTKGTLSDGIEVFSQIKGEWFTIEKKGIEFSVALSENKSGVTRKLTLEFSDFKNCTDFLTITQYAE